MRQAFKRLAVIRKENMFRYAAALVFLTSAVERASAIEAPCALTTMVETTPPTYLPLARAARIEGLVVLMAEFGTDGTVTKVDVLDGPVMLQTGAVDFVKGWKANAYTGSRTCPLAVTYVLGEGDQVTGQRIDAQHYKVIGAAPPCLCDPPAETGHKRKRFLLF
jgi:Gram-negative bacterial TonB protein C-terminal